MQCPIHDALLRSQRWEWESQFKLEGESCLWRQIIKVNSYFHEDKGLP